MIESPNLLTESIFYLSVCLCGFFFCLAFVVLIYPYPFRIFFLEKLQGRFMMFVQLLVVSVMCTFVASVFVNAHY